MVFYLVVGHSQGGGTSQIIASLFGLERVVMLAGGVGVDPLVYPQHTFTSTDKYFSFCHTSDSLYTGIQNVNTLSLGMTAPIIDQDTSAFPYSNSNRISTSIASGNPHGAISTDSDLALDVNGFPIYQPVWRYLFAVPRSGAVSWLITPSLTLTIVAMAGSFVYI